ncbi:MAG TPA: nucleoside recognition domain-containing protein, partial [Candidatus Krumholzibacterium sp.]|nr:nucleoside recognition domain-containing protein [Candidatus Krumholzibacterium sp.]
GLGVLAVVVYMIYQFVGVFAAGRLVDLIETGVFDRLIIPGVKRIAGEGFIYDILVGQYGLVSMGLSYSISIVLPIVLVFFLIFGILEDTGYFPRLTVLTNNAFKIVGVNGKATLPVVLGFGCVTMAILASRILETRRERIIVITLLSLAIPCSAQLGVMLALMSAISIAAVVTISVIVLAEFVVVGSLLGRILKGETSDFILELPPLRIPRLRNIVLKTGARAKWFLVEAVPYFILATVVLFFLDRTGAMEYIYKAVEPVASRLLGLPVETASVFIIGFFRRDYGAAGLYRMWQSGLLTGNQITVALTVMSLFLPCLASLIVMIKELGIRYAMLIFIAVMVISILTGGALNLVLSAAGVSF